VDQANQRIPHSQQLRVFACTSVGWRLGRPVLGGPVHFIPDLRSVRLRQAFWQRT
jgi:hypothetical protein